MDLGIQGRKAAVAAGSAGLGLESARALAAEGVRVAICGRDPGRLKEALTRLPDDAVGLEVDLSSPDEGARFVAEAREALGGLDIVVCNAGGPPPGTFATTDLDAYQKAIDLNLLSTVAMCREAVPSMQAQHWGRVVAITSIGVRQPIPNLMASVTARVGLTGFLKVLAREVAGDGITVNSLQPGFHATDRLTKVAPNLDALAAQVPAGFIGTAHDFGQFTAFLCSEQARFVTGTSIQLDGGAYSGLL